MFLFSYPLYSFKIHLQYMYIYKVPSKSIGMAVTLKAYRFEIIRYNGSDWITFPDLYILMCYKPLVAFKVWS